MNIISNTSQALVVNDLGRWKIESITIIYFGTLLYGDDRLCFLQECLNALVAPVSLRLYLDEDPLVT